MSDFSQCRSLYVFVNGAWGLFDCGFDTRQYLMSSTINVSFFILSLPTAVFTQHEDHLPVYDWCPDQTLWDRLPDIVFLVPRPHGVSSILRCVPLIGQVDRDLSSHLKGGHLWMLKHKYLMHQREYSKTASHPDGKVPSRKAKDNSEVHGWALTM